MDWDNASDNCSSTPTYLVALGTSSGDDSIVSWTSVSSSSHAFSSLSLTEGDTIFMSVKSVDEALLESAVSSLSFVVPGAPDAPVLGLTTVGIDTVTLGWRNQMIIIEQYLTMWLNIS